MNSGIYIYTFTSGAQYIGQAIDIKDRWQQHIKKMQAGKHTKLVQAEYNRCGLPDFDVLLQCHPHYLDAMEALYIYNYKPALNTAIPKMYLTKNISSQVNQTPQYDRLAAEIELKEIELVELKARIIEIAKEKLPIESQKILREAENAAYKANTRLKEAQEALLKLGNKVKVYNAAGWWYKLWNKV
jgi:hypothetical protein